MKNYLKFMLAAFATVAAVSCAKEEIEAPNVQEETQTPDQENVQLVPLTLNVTGDNAADTKTDIADNNKTVVWCEDDAIAVYDASGVWRKFTIKEGTIDGGSALFEGEVAEGTTDIYVVYPFDAAVSCADGKVVATTMTEQTIESGKVADGAIVATMDQLHYEQAKALLEQNYHLLLEKPVVNNAEQLEELRDMAVNRDRIMMVGHVLRYTPFYGSIKQDLLDGKVGQIMHIETSELVGVCHASCSYIRGKWKSEAECGSGMLLAKCCHDIDLICWLNNVTQPTEVVSYGGRNFITPNNAPKNSPKRCYDDCPHLETCRFSAKSLYVDNDLFPIYSYPNIKKPHEEITLDEKLNALKTDDPMMENLFAHCAACKMPVLIHIATQHGGMYGIEDDLGLPRLEKMMKKYPDLIVIGHSQAFWSEMSGDITEETRGGYPRGKVTSEGRIYEMMRACPNLYCDLSAGSGMNALRRDTENAAKFIEEFSDRILYGCDICGTKNKHQYEFDAFLTQMVEDGLMSEENYRKIVRTNAIRLLGLDMD
jgi:hypothetical protein